MNATAATAQASLNDYWDRSGWGAPRVFVRLEDDFGVQDLGGVETLTLDQNAYNTPDTFALTIPFAPALHNRTLAQWMSGLTVKFHFYVGFEKFEADGGTTYDRMMLGVADTIELASHTAGLNFAGRDLSALLVDARTEEKFANLTSSAIATLLAVRHGLTPVVTATATPVGRFYEQDHARLTREQSEWQLLTYLAQQESFQVWVDGDALHFAPEPDLATATPWVLDYHPGDAGKTRFGPAYNATQLTFGRSYLQARDAEVTVLSFSSRANRTVKSVRKSPNAHRKAGAVQKYVFKKPDLTQAQADALAEQKLEEITRHERTLKMVGPADRILSPRVPLLLQGTGTDLDGRYYVDQVERQFGTDSASMTASAKNHPTRSVASVS